MESMSASASKVVVLGSYCPTQSPLQLPGEGHFGKIGRSMGLTECRWEFQ